MTSTEAARNKEAVRKRDGYKCTRCGMTNDEHRLRVKEYHGRNAGRSLHVHRIVPTLGYLPSNCTTLCYSCHGRESRKRPSDELREITLLMSDDMLSTIDDAAQKRGVTLAEFVATYSLASAKKILKKSAKNLLTL